MQKKAKVFVCMHNNAHAYTSMHKETKMCKMMQFFFYCSSLPTLQCILQMAPTETEARTRSRARDSREKSSRRRDRGRDRPGYRDRSRDRSSREESSRRRDMGRDRPGKLATFYVVVG